MKSYSIIIIPLGEKIEAIYNDNLNKDEVVKVYLFLI